MRVRATTGERLHCVALRKDGQPCQAFASTPDGRCMMHGPRGAQLHRMGGAAHSNVNRAIKLLPQRLAPLVEKLESVFDELYAHSTAQRAARDAAALATIAVAICKVYEAGELEERMRDLERWTAEQDRAAKRTQAHGTLSKRVGTQ